MFSKNINFKNFNKIKIKNDLKKNLKLLIKENKPIIQSLSNNYKDKYNFKKYKKITKDLDLKIIGMGGSILGAKAIYDFLNHKIKKKVIFIDNLSDQKIDNKKKYLNLVISKSGNTLETISNLSLNLKKKDKNIFITENKPSELITIAKKLKSEIIEHNNFIGGRYSVLSEVGMLPSEIMGLNPKKFRQLDNLIKNKNFLNSLILNVQNILKHYKNKKYNSVIINYSNRLDGLFNWYQQLVAESLGKKNKGILPMISKMPKDNHSLMQLYLDGKNINFYTFAFVHEKKSNFIKNSNLSNNFKFLRNNSVNKIISIQKKATENVFFKRKKPFRTFEIKNINEESIGELFCFFILETILLGRALNVNPYDQPSVELIKKETKKIFGYR